MNKKDQEIYNEFYSKMLEAQKHLEEYFKEKNLPFFAVIYNPVKPNMQCIATTMDNASIKFGCERLLESEILIGETF